jgi:hypothetical protein
MVEVQIRPSSRKRRPRTGASPGPIPPSMSTHPAAVAEAPMVGEPHPSCGDAPPLPRTGLVNVGSSWLFRLGRGNRSASVWRRREAPRDRETPATRAGPGLGLISALSRRSVEMPYFTCPRFRIGHYSAASWAYAPECPTCLERLNRPSHLRDRVVSISRRKEGEARDLGAARDEPSCPGEHR